MQGQGRTANPAARPSEIEPAARELLDAVYDRSHGHIHFDYAANDEWAERANTAARRLADALGIV